jgi:hypothetical protein
VRRSAWIVLGLVLAAAAVVLLFVFGVFGNRTVPSAPKSSVSPATHDAYIERTVTGYLAAIAAGQADRIQRLRDGVIDPQEARTSALGRFASGKIAAFQVRSIHDEQFVSANGLGSPATGWSAIATVDLIQGAARHSLDIRLSGTYGSEGTVDSAELVSSGP